LAKVNVIAKRIGAPAEEEITGGLHQPLPLHHTLAQMPWRNLIR
jgi:hypothetical protein